MTYKIQEIINKSKKYLIVYLIFWIILNILLIIPVSYSYVNASVDGNFKLDVFIEMFTNAITKPIQLMKVTFSAPYLGNYINLMIGFTLVYIIFLIFATIKSGKGHEYKNIEHGSSDWSENGEQYTILSNKEGIILAEKNYLPVDKRGNVNVLIVGRIRFR